jgi:glycosyltransferase 2 family protein
VTMRRVVFRAVQIAITLVLIWLLLTRIAWGELLVLIVQLQWGWLVLGLLLIGVTHLFTVARWRWLLQTSSPGYGRLLVYYSAGLFASNFLPTGMGGDAVRAALLSRDTGWPIAVLSVGFDRVIGLASFSALFLIGMWLGTPPSGAIGILFKSLRTALFIIPIGLLLATTLCVIAWKVWPGLRQRTKVIRSQLREYGRSWSLVRWIVIVTNAYLLSVFMNLLLMGAQDMVFRALSIVLPAGAAVWVVFFGSLSLLLPIALNGLGVMEGTYVLVLSSYGVSATGALAAALITRALMIFYSLLGGAISLAWKPQKSSESRRSAG